VPDVLENNAYLLATGFAIAAGIWWMAARLKSWRARRAVRVSAIFLAAPIVYLGHPFLFYQSWMMLVAYAQSREWLGLSVYFGLWVMLVSVSQLRRRRPVSSAA
jgi:predicted MFS family arabinose efflux permease